MRNNGRTGGVRDPTGLKFGVRVNEYKGRHVDSSGMMVSRGVHGESGKGDVGRGDEDKGVEQETGPCSLVGLVN